MVTIEPIKNQYLTALKERQQIIDKLNEIISGLNALNFDDLTTIQAELVAIRESLQTQNTAITQINNSISQIESELTSFDNRLITLNTNIENTESHLTSFENDTVLNLQSKVNKNGDTMTGNLGIPTTTTGSRNKLAVNGERLQNDLDNYSSMIRTTGDQNFTGVKTTTSKLIGVYYGSVGIDTSNGFVIAERDTNVNVVDKPTISRYFPPLLFEDGGGNRIGGIRIVHNSDGTSSFCVSLRNANGTSKNIILATSDV